LLDLAKSLDALDRLGEGVFALDAEGRFTYLNHIARHLLPGLTGSSAPDLLGTIIWDASPSFSQTPVATALRRAQIEGTPVAHPVRDPVSGRTLEFRIYPGASGSSCLLMEPSTLNGVGVLDALSDLYLVCDDEWRLTALNARTSG